MISVIGTPQGKILHSSDFKLDPNPIDGRLTDMDRIAELAVDPGIRMLLCDSTNADVAGSSASESEIGPVLKGVFHDNEDRRVIVACFSSHIHRVQQIVAAALSQGRKIATLGMSMKRNVTLATTLAKVALTIERKEAGVLVTDFTSSRAMLQKMISTLKQQLPELVTIVASNGRDTTDMISLINHGQVFRYVEKPVDSDTLRTDVNAAVLKHLQLLEHPELIQRHQVLSMTTPPAGSPTLNQFIGKVTGLRGRWTNTSNKSH